MRCTVLIFVLIVMTACSNKVDFTANHTRHFDFSTITSYSLFDRNSPFSEYQNMADADRNSIEIAIEKGFDSQGWHYKPIERADIIITYHIVDKYKDLKRYDKGVKYCRPCLPVNVPADSSAPKMLRPGTLVLDMLDRESKRTMWRGTSKLNIKHDDHHLETQEKVARAVSALITTIPR